MNLLWRERLVIAVPFFSHISVTQEVTGQTVLLAVVGLSFRRSCCSAGGSGVLVTIAWLASMNVTESPQKNCRLYSSAGVIK